MILRKVLNLRTGDRIKVQPLWHPNGVYSIRNIYLSGINRTTLEVTGMGAVVLMELCPDDLVELAQE